MQIAFKLLLEVHKFTVKLLIFAAIFLYYFWQFCVDLLFLLNFTLKKGTASAIFWSLQNVDLVQKL